MTEVSATSFSESPGSGSFDYDTRYRAAGQVIDISCNTVTVNGGNAPAPNPTPTPTPGNAECVASVNGATVSLAWDAVPGESSYAVRRNNVFVTEVNATNFSESPGSGSFDYDIRYRVAGQVIDISCNPVTVGGGNGGNTPTPTPAGGEFVPQQGVTYRLTAQNGSVLAGNAGGARDAFALSSAAAAANLGAVSWEFVDAGNGQYHIDLASGGDFSRLTVTDNAGEPLFARLTRDRFTGGDKTFAIQETSPGSGLYHITALDNRINGGNDRLVLTNNDAGFTSPNTTGSNVTFTITPAG